MFLFASLFWAWLWIGSFLNRIEILINKDNYSLSTFVVESVEYHDSSNPNEVDLPSYHANGIVNGQSERLSLLHVFASIPKSLEEVQLAVPAGTTFPVLYNPTLTRTIVQGETLRVIPFKDGYWKEQKRMAVRIGKRMFLPLLLAIFAKVVVKIWIKSQNKSMQMTVNGTHD